MFLILSVYSTLSGGHTDIVFFTTHQMLDLFSRSTIYPTDKPDTNSNILPHLNAPFLLLTYFIALLLAEALSLNLRKPVEAIRSTDTDIM